MDRRLDFSLDSVSLLDEYIHDQVMNIRIALDLDDRADVGDELGNILDQQSLSAYLGELFVRHFQGDWEMDEYGGIS